MHTLQSILSIPSPLPTTHTYFNSYLSLWPVLIVIKNNIFVSCSQINNVSVVHVFFFLLYGTHRGHVSAFRRKYSIFIKTTLVCTLQVFFNSPAEGELQRGDVILSVNGRDTSQLTHVQALDLIKHSSGQLQLVIDRYKDYSFLRSQHYELSMAT